MILTGADAKRVGYYSKAALRDFVATNLFYNGGVSVLLVQQIQGEEVPTGGAPLITIRTQERQRRQCRVRDETTEGDGWEYTFSTEWRVITNQDSGGVVVNDNEVPSGEEVSDLLDDVLTTIEGEQALLALGIEKLMIGQRREDMRDGVFTNRHTITYCVYALKE